MAIVVDTTDIRGRLTPDAEIAPFTWFRVGGRAEHLFQPADADDLALFLSRLDPAIPVHVIGVGSNLLVRDGGIAGVVIRLSAKASAARSARATRSGRARRCPTSAWRPSLVTKALAASRSSTASPARLVARSG